MKETKESNTEAPLAQPGGSSRQQQLLLLSLVLEGKGGELVTQSGVSSKLGKTSELVGSMFAWMPCFSIYGVTIPADTLTTACEMLG